LHLWGGCCLGMTGLGRATAVCTNGQRLKLSWRGNRCF